MSQSEAIEPRVVVRSGVYAEANELAAEVASLEADDADREGCWPSPT